MIYAINSNLTPARMVKRPSYSGGPVFEFQSGDRQDLLGFSRHFSPCVQIMGCNKIIHDRFLLYFAVHFSECIIQGRITTQRHVTHLDQVESYK